MKEFDHPIFGKELHFEFESFTKAMNKPNQKFEQALRREYEIEKQPKKISGQLVKGDVGPFIEKFKTHFNAYKAAQPMKKEKAFKIATDYVENYSYPIAIDLVNAERKENLLDFEGPVWLFSMPDLGQSVVVSEKSEKVLCMLSRSNQKAFPHDYENPLSKEEAFAIGKKYLAERHPEAKAIFAKTLFYQGGMNNIKDPVWHVGATLPPSRFDGQNEISLWISVRSKQVEDTEIS